jgi:LysR family cys regulon transcriptional activator
MLIDEVAEIGFATESLVNYDELVTLPCYEWQHMLVLPAGHPLARKDRITLEDVAQEPIITYHPSFTGRTRIDHAFATRHLTPRIALEAIDSDLVVRPAGQLFGQNVARVAFKRGAYLRNFVYKFAEFLSDRLDRNLITKAMTGHVNDYEL